MITITIIFLIAAIVIALLSAIGKAPLWVSVICLAIIEALRVLPR